VKPPMSARGPTARPEALGDHTDRLFRAARNMCASPQGAEDVVQETFAAGAEKPRRRGSGNDLRYLLTVLRNTFISTRRTAAKQAGRARRRQAFEGA
jgi:DNA-directed RNA polymerase specialized sigma24 family protein